MRNTKSLLLLLTALVVFWFSHANADDYSAPSNFTPAMISTENFAKIVKQNEDAVKKCRAESAALTKNINYDDPSMPKDPCPNPTADLGEPVDCTSCPECMKARGVDCGTAIKDFAAEEVSIKDENGVVRRAMKANATDRTQ